MKFTIVRSGSHTVFRNLLFLFFEKENQYCLVYNGHTPPFDGFTRITDEIYTTCIPKQDLKNAFYMETRCMFRGYEFHVENNNGTFLRILTDSSEAQEKLNLEWRDRGVYQTVVEINELDMLWEERTKSPFNIPFPDDLIHSKFIYLDTGSNDVSDASKL